MGDLVRLFRYLKKYAGIMTLSLTFLLVSTALNLVQPKLVEWAVDFGISGDVIRTVVLGALGIFGAALIGAGLNFTSGMMLVKAGQGMGYDIRNDLFKKVMSFAFADHDKWRTGELLNRVNSDVNTVRMFIRMGLLMIIQSLIMLVGSLIIMYRTNAQLANVMAIILPATLGIFFIAASFIRPLFTKVRERLDEVNNVLQENLAGAKVVRAFARQEFEKSRFDEKNRNFLKVSLKVGYIIGMLFPLLFFIGQFSIIMITITGGRAVIEGILNPGAVGLTLGQLLAFTNYAMMAMFPIIALGMVLNFISMASASAVRIEELLTEEPKIIDDPNSVSVQRFRGSLELEGVSFAYGSGENAVDNIDLKIEGGEKVGILGRTGSGKSSLAYLIPRFYDTSRGTISIDGRDIKDLKLDDLRKRVTLVLQETVLLAGSIRENVAYAHPDASQEALEKAAEIACATEFISEKDEGWESHVGERGAGLSGGQRQRVAIARAILNDPDILILDDVTSSVDASTERTIVENLYRELEGKTVLIISQKVNTVMRADRIILMEDGKIAAQGTHDELLKSNSVYREIFETQSAEIRA